MGLRATLKKIAAGTAVAAVVTTALVSVLAMAAPVAPVTRDSLPRLDTLASPIRSLLGLSGRLRAVSVPHGREWESPLAALVPALATPSAPGVVETGLEAPDGEPIHLISLVPLSRKAGPTWRGYRIGFWPGERPSARGSRYLLPDGFIEVTPENADVPISESFRLRDFLTKDQPNVWPKVLVLRLPLLDKLELIRQELEARGRPSTVRVMSGFRTPQYNALGVGKGGRARDSRHMYGDAADIYVDADGDGRMDDLDGDGRVTIKDAGWLARIAEQVENDYPAMTGGIGVYRANAVHGPFVHVDVRGTPARW